MSRSFPLHDGDHAVIFDDDIAVKLNGYDLRLLAGRIIAICDNHFFDLQNLIAGGGTITRNSDPYDLQRKNLIVQHYQFGGHGELTFTDAEKIVSMIPMPATGRSHSFSVQPVQLCPDDHRSFLPFEETRNVPNIAADAIHNAATQLTLSHWPANRTPECYEANLSTESVFRFLAGNERLNDTQYVTTDHFDLDGLASVYALLAPDHAQSHKQLLINIARFGDFASGHSTKARRLAFSLNTIAVQTINSTKTLLHESSRIAALFSTMLPALRDLLDDEVLPELLWHEAEQQYHKTEKLLDNQDIIIEQYPEIDLALFRLPKDTVSELNISQRYFGLSPIAFHNRTLLSTIAIVVQNDIVIQQRYEGWVALTSSAPRPRRDLAIFARSLQEAETSNCRWHYDGVQHIMPRLGYTTTQRSFLPVERIISELQHFLTIAPAAWSPSV
ncbi:DUF6687 family protein [Xenorhabdus thailandensis]|uniref:DUF6687 family protein n=1 Tax=Xenorhabdus thailandensis TaxID=3136255 RepID=UPI0030F45E30